MVIYPQNRPIQTCDYWLISPTQQTLFFSMWVFFHEHWWITGLQGKGRAFHYLLTTPFHPLHRHLDISGTMTAESLPLHIASSRTRTGNLWFPSASYWPGNYKTAGNYKMTPLIVQCQFQSIVWLRLKLSFLSSQELIIYQNSPSYV